MAKEGKKHKKHSFVLLTGRLELPRVVIMEPLLSVGSSEIEGNCADQFKLDEFLWKVLITASPFFFSLFYILFSRSCSLRLVALSFVTLTNVLFFCEWRVLLEEVTTERGSG